MKTGSDGDMETWRRSGPAPGLTAEPFSLSLRLELASEMSDQRPSRGLCSYLDHHITYHEQRHCWMRFAVASPSCHEAIAHSYAAALTLWLSRTGAKLRATEVQSALPGYPQGM